MDFMLVTHYIFVINYLKLNGNINLTITFSSITSLLKPLKCNKNFLLQCFKQTSLVILSYEKVPSLFFPLK